MFRTIKTKTKNTLNIMFDARSNLTAETRANGLIQNIMRLSARRIDPDNDDDCPTRGSLTVHRSK